MDTQPNDIMLPSPPSALTLLQPPRNLTSQFESATQTALPDNLTVADLPRAVWRNKRYVLEESLSRKGSKGRKSWIKHHGFFLVEVDADGNTLNPYWACRLCDAKGRPEFFAAAATSSAADHLRKSHRIFESSQSADTDLSTDDSNRSKRPRLHDSAVPRAKVKVIRELSLGLLINTDVPFSFFTDPFFEQLAWQLDPCLSGQVPWSRQSMSRLLEDVYRPKKDQVKQELVDALTKIHLGFDLWTSPNRYAMMAVTAHFLNRQGKHQSRLLALRRQLGCHSGENLAVTLLQVVQEWKIEDRVGTVISDNVSSNDSCLQNFYPSLNTEMRPEDIRARRMRCYGHILNLVARAFLYGEDFEAFEAESQVLNLLGHHEEDLRHWRKKGPVGKLHNIVKFIRSSPQRCELFKRIARENDEAQGFLLTGESTAELEVVQNNDTRWNSTYLMISRALIKQGDIRAFLVHPDVEGWLPQGDSLKGDDWRLLAELKQILEPFYLQTMRAQGWGSGGGHGRLWEVMTGMEYLLEHLEDRKLLYRAASDEMTGENVNSQTKLPRGRPGRNRQLPARFKDCEMDMQPRKLQDGPLQDRGRGEYGDQDKASACSSKIDDMGRDHRQFMRLSITTAWQKLNEYYTRLGESPLFAASIILHPALGMSYLEANWATEEQLVWVRDAKMGLSDYLDRWYCCTRSTAADDRQKTNVETPTSLCVSRNTKEDSVFKQWVKSRRARATVMGSELERYLRLEAQETEDPIEWWMAHQGSFPVLSQLALDILAIPAMATDCERSFSLAKLTLTSQRLSMSAETLEKLQCLKNWIRHGAVKLGATRLGRDELHWDIESSMESTDSGI